MTVRLHFYILTLLVMTLISIQHPVSIVNSDVSPTKYPDLQASKYKEKEDRSQNARFKRQVTDESIESHYNNQHALTNLKKKTKENNDRNKRLETEEDDGVMERNQFYKSINEEIKEVQPVVSFKQDKEGKPDHKIANDLLSPAKLTAAKVARSQRQETGGWGKVTGLPDRAGGHRDKSQRPEELNGNSVDGTYMLASNSVQRIGRENYEMQELAGISFSPETQETMRKINPLTIGDQVSQMIHDRHCKAKNKPTSIQERHENKLPTFRCGLAPQRHEDQAGVPQADEVAKLLAASKKEQNHEDQAGTGVSQADEVPKLLLASNKEQHHEDQAGTGVPQADEVPKLLAASKKEQNHEDQAGTGVSQADEVPKLLAASNKEQPPKIVQKPSSSHDYGFSVYLLAGDPPKSGGSGAHNDNQKANGASNNIEQCKYAIKTDYNKINSANVKSTSDELRVEKKPNPNVEFPVYDQDLTFTPDPLHGLLEQHDRIDPVRKEVNALPFGGSPAFPRHMVHARSAKKKNSKNSSTISWNNNGNKDGVINGREEGDSAVDSSADGDSAGDSSADGDSAGDSSADGDIAGDDSQTPDMEPSGDSNSDINKTCCKSWNSADNGSSADDSVGGDGKSSDVEPFGDLKVDTNKTSCLSWNDNAAGNDTSGCGMTEETTTGAAAESNGPRETATTDAEFCGDLDINTNKTCCQSWREPNKSKLTLT